MKKFVIAVSLLVCGSAFAQEAGEIDSTKVFEEAIDWCGCPELRDSITFDSVETAFILVDKVLPDGSVVLVQKPSRIAWFTDLTGTRFNGFPFGIPVREEFIIN